MLYDTQSRQVKILGDTMNYIEFGTGQNPLVILPGLSDGLSPVGGRFQAIALALTHKQFLRDYKVYIFSRKNHLEPGYSTRMMAKDQAEAMKAIGVSSAAVMGVSQGGMIAQFLAADYPKLVSKLVLVVTLAQANEIIQSTVNEWIKFAKQGDYKSLMLDTAERSYSDAYLRKYRFIYPLLGMFGKPKNFDRFIIEAMSCTKHNSYSELEKIVCPTFIIGGGQDKIVGPTSALELAKEIRNCEIFVYEDYGHAVYEEVTDFNNRILHFLMEKSYGEV